MISQSLQKKSFSQLHSLVIVTNVVPPSKYVESLGYIVQFVIWSIKDKQDWINLRGRGGGGLYWCPLLVID